MLGKVTCDEHLNALERYWKGDISYTLTKSGSLSRIKGKKRCNFTVIQITELVVGLTLSI